MSTEPEAKPETGWLARLRAGLRRSSSKLTSGIASILGRGGLDAEALEQLEELLITADLGPSAAAKLVGALDRRGLGRTSSAEAVRTALADEIAQILTPVAQPLSIDPAHRPHVVLIVGVNGSGKTTTIGKLAKLYREQGLVVTLAAGDTFRAAAVEQLKVWGQRTGCTVISGEEQADPASIAYRAFETARDQAADLLLIDTAGRLHNKAELMAQLEKINRVLNKQDESAPHDVVLVLDGTTGQNALTQVDTFKQLAAVTGLVVTKLDGSARGGVLVALAERTGLPVHAIGIGEGADDLRPFAPEDFARSLVGADAD